MIIRISGGLGNQIYQLGAGLLLAKKVGCESIVIDTNGLLDYKVKHTNYLVDYFDFSRSSINIVFKQLFFSKARLPKLLPLKIPNYPLVGDKNFQTALKGVNKFLWMDGYFTSSLTQENFNEEVEILKPLLLQKEMPRQDGCVIHIRGTDYIELGGGDMVPSEFYISSVYKMKQDYGIKDFFVVTDDKEYATSILKDVDFSFIGGNMKEDFHLIGKFQFRILSFSSFSLWASALGSNYLNNIVIAPSKFGSRRKRPFGLPNEIDFGKYG